MNLYKQNIVDTIGSIDDLVELKTLEIRKINDLIKYIFISIKPEKSALLFKNVFKTYNGGSFKSAEYVNEAKNKLITIKNIDDDGFNTRNTSGLKLTNSAEKFRLFIGDILITMTGNIGRVGIVDCDDCFLNQRVLKIESINKFFTYAYLIYNKENIIKIGKGTAQQNLGLSDLYTLPVNYSIDTIKGLGKYDHLINKIIYNKCEIHKLHELKQLYLKKFFR